MTGKTQTIVTVGASEALDLAFRAVIEPGDGSCLRAVPMFRICRGRLCGQGGGAHRKQRNATVLRLQPQALEAAVTPKTKAIILPYPNTRRARL